MEVLRHKLATRGLKRMRREDIHAFLWALADFQFDMRNEQMRAAREKSRENGTWREGRKPYGTHPQEAKNVETMKRMAREGKTCKATADYFNSNDITSRYGKPWRGSVIAKILRRAGISRGKHPKIKAQNLLDIERWMDKNVPHETKAGEKAAGREG